MKEFETDILGHALHYLRNTDLRDTLEESKDMCWTCLARFYLCVGVAKKSPAHGVRYSG